MGKNQTGERGVIEAAGGLLWRETATGREIALIHRPRYDDWTFPKGWREKGEKYIETATREVAEETNCTFEIRDFAGSVSYLVQGVPKIVLFWNMMLIEEYPLEINDEVDRLLWLDVESALAKMTYEGERKLLKRILYA